MGPLFYGVNLTGSKRRKREELKALNYAMFDPKRSTFKQGADKAMEIVLLDQYKQPVDLTGAVVKVRIAALENLFLEKDVSITDPLAGVISLSFTESEQLRAGFYEAEFEVTYLDQQKEIFPDSTYLKIQVVKNLKQRQDSFVVSTDLTKMMMSIDEFMDNAINDIDGGGFVNQTRGIEIDGGEF